MGPDHTKANTLRLIGREIWADGHLVAVLATNAPGVIDLAFRTLIESSGTEYWKIRERIFKAGTNRQ